MSYACLRTRVEAGVGWIEFCRPPVNAFDWTMLEETPLALAAHLGAPEVRVVVFASALERYFTAGGDIAVLRALTAESMLRWTTISQEIAQLLRESPKPLLAAINGTAVGGGLEIAARCDVRFAAADARLGQPEIRIGFFPPLVATRTLALRWRARSGATGRCASFRGQAAGGDRGASRRAHRHNRRAAGAAD